MKKAWICNVLFLLCAQSVRTCFGLPLQQRRPPGTANGTKHVPRLLVNNMGDYELCDVCMEGVTLLSEFISSQRTFADIKPHAINLCVKVLTEKGYRGDQMCPGIVESYGPGTWFIFVQLSLDPLTVCEKLNYCLPSMDLWKTIEQLHEYKPDRIPHREIALDREANDTVSGTEKTLRILQISDIHVDPSYTTGAATDCGLYLCCRSQFNGTGSAGQFGNYNRCDLPVGTLDIVLSAIRDVDPAPDFIIYTGDSPPHDVWQESWAKQLQADILVVEKVNEKLKSFTIYPAIGNHESFPESFYYQPSTAYQALNSKLASLWGSWFNVSADQRENIETSAYYTTLVRPGLRILSFNTDYGYLANFYFLLNDRIPAYWEQQQFMKDVLDRARRSNEKVIIIGHVPPGDKGSSTMDYGDFYTALAVNYSDVIALHLFGHTHHDEFEVILNPSSQTPHGPIFISPSVTTYGKVNPGFRVYDLDPRTFRLLDYEQYYLNITAANAGGGADVKLLYTAKKEYGLSDMSAQSWKSLSDRLKTDKELLSRFRRNYLTGSGLQGSCDESCQQVTWCKTRSASLRAYLNCLYEVHAWTSAPGGIKIIE